MATHKLDIFDVLRKISNSNMEYWNSLEEEQQKAFASVVILRWLSSNNKFEIFMLNSLVNRYVFDLGKHKELLYNLMTICTIPNSRYSWIKRQAKDVKFPKSTKAVSEYLGYSIKETKNAIVLYNNEEILEICKELGYQKKDITDIKRELKVRNV